MTYCFIEQLVIKIDKWVYDTWFSWDSNAIARVHYRHNNNNNNNNNNSDNNSNNNFYIIF